MGLFERTYPFGRSAARSRFGHAAGRTSTVSALLRCAVIFALIAASAVGAVPSPVVSRSGFGLVTGTTLALANAASEALPLPAPNGAVLASALSPDGRTLYIGGNFTQVGSSPRSHLAAIDLWTRTVMPWNPGVDDPVTCMKLSGTTLYVGGYFDNVVVGAGFLPRGHLAAFDAESGMYKPWDPNADQVVYALHVSGTSVYAGGNFTKVGNVTRNGLVQTDATSGAVRSWNPNATGGGVWAIVPVGSTLYVGGYFTKVGGTARSYLAAVNASTGALTPWNPSANAAVLTMAASGSTIFAGGNFTAVGPFSRQHLVAMDASTGQPTAFDARIQTGSVGCIVVQGANLYAGGTFTKANDADRGMLAAFDTGTGALRYWTCDANDLVRSLTISGFSLYVGGEFTSLGGRADIDSLGEARWPVNLAAGADRYETAVNASRLTFAGGKVSSVVLATGRNYPDALSAAGLAGAVKGPILLVDGRASTVPSLVLAEIDRLTAGSTSRKIYVCGGEGAVSKAIAASLDKRYGAGTVERVWGATRYLTANAIARKTAQLLGGSVSSVFLTTGASFYDAEIAGPVSYRHNMPILLAGPVDAALISTLKEIGKPGVNIVGSTASVPPATQTALTKAGFTVMRPFAEPDPYGQSVAFAETFTGKGGAFIWARPGFATSAAFPDALAAASTLGGSKWPGPLLFTPPNTTSAAVMSCLTSHKGFIYSPTIFGGTGAISQAARDRIMDALQ